MVNENNDGIMECDFCGSLNVPLLEFDGHHYCDICHSFVTSAFISPDAKLAVIANILRNDIHNCIYERIGDLEDQILDLKKMIRKGK